MGTTSVSWDSTMLTPFQRDKGERVRFYIYTDAVTLLSDFWTEVDLILKERGTTP
jgi:hypothetical protein